MDISIRFNYGGFFEFVNGRLLYKKGSVYIKKDVDPDILCTFDLSIILKEDISLDGVKELWWLKSKFSLTDGLTPLLVNNDLMQMIADTDLDRVCHVYVVLEKGDSPSSVLVNKPILRRSPRKHLSSASNQTSLTADPATSEAHSVHCESSISASQPQLSIDDVLPAALDSTARQLPALEADFPSIEQGTLLCLDTEGDGEIIGSESEDMDGDVRGLVESDVDDDDDFFYSNVNPRFCIRPSNCLKLVKRYNFNEQWG